NPPSDLGTQECQPSYHRCSTVDDGFISGRCPCSGRRRPRFGPVMMAGPGRVRGGWGAGGCASAAGRAGRSVGWATVGVLGGGAGGGSGGREAGKGGAGTEAGGAAQASGPDFGYGRGGRVIAVHGWATGYRPAGFPGGLGGRQVQVSPVPLWPARKPYITAAP